jgi:hypothetical protein
MGISGGPDTIQDGLVLCLDASDKNSYPGSGTTWTNMLSSNNGTLTNGPTFNSANNGSIVFDGTNDYVTTSTTVSIGNTFTVNAWIKVTTLAPGGTSNRRSIVGNDYPYLSGRGFLFTASGNNSTDFWVSLGNDQKVAVSTTGLISANVIYMLSVRVNGTDLIKLYRNGTEVPSYAVQNDGNVSLTYSNPCLIGCRNTNSDDSFIGNIYNVQIYNRALSDLEIKQNYNSQKSRFGL